MTSSVERTIASLPIAPDIVEAGRLPQVQRVGLGYLARFARLGVDLRSTGYANPEAS